MTDLLTQHEITSLKLVGTQTITVRVYCLGGERIQPSVLLAGPVPTSLYYYVEELPFCGPSHPMSNHKPGGRTGPGSLHSSSQCKSSEAGPEATNGVEAVTHCRCLEGAQVYMGYLAMRRSGSPRVTPYAALGLAVSRHLQCSRSCATL